MTRVWGPWKKFENYLLFAQSTSTFGFSLTTPDFWEIDTMFDKLSIIWDRTWGRRKVSWFYNSLVAVRFRVSSISLVPSKIHMSLAWRNLRQEDIKSIRCVAFARASRLANVKHRLWSSRYNYNTEDQNILRMVISNEDLLLFKINSSVSNINLISNNYDEIRNSNDLENMIFHVRLICFPHFAHCWTNSNSLGF